MKTSADYTWKGKGLVRKGTIRWCSAIFLLSSVFFFLDQCLFFLEHAGELCIFALRRRFCQVSLCTTELNQFIETANTITSALSLTPVQDK